MGALVQTTMTQTSSPSSDAASSAVVTDYLVARLWTVSVNFMGWPIHCLASLLCLVSTRLALRVRLATKRLVGMIKAGPSTKNKSCAAKSGSRRFVVRLKNLPQSDEFFINKRGRLIHVRSYVPSDPASIRAVVVFSHGYGAHCNSPRKHQMGLTMPQQGVCMYQMDLQGHGYSEGERAYVDHYNDWVDDFRQLLELVAGDARACSKGNAAKNGSGAPHFNFTSTEQQRKRLREVPIFISGESLGGALSILLGLHLQETNHPLLPRFKGQVLLAPAIKGNPPPAVLVNVLRYLVAPLIPKWQIPSCLESVNRSDMCVLELDERRHAEHDVLGYPGGLGWGGNMRFRTGLQMIDLTAEVSRRLGHVEFPFLVMHDPGDSIVQFDSSKELTFKARTPHGSPRGRELRPMDGWLHSLLTNCPEITIQHMSDWILYQTSLCESNMLRGGLTGHGGESVDRRRPTGAKRLPASIPRLRGGDVDSAVTSGGRGVDTDGSSRTDGCGGGEDGHGKGWRGYVGGRSASGSKAGGARGASKDFVDTSLVESTGGMRGSCNGVKAATAASVPAVDENADGSDEGEGQREGRSVPKNAAGLLSPVGDVAATAAAAASAVLAPATTERLAPVVAGTRLVTANLCIDSPSSCSNTAAPSPRAENLSRCSSISDDMSTVSAAVRLPSGGGGGQGLLQGR